MRKNTAKVSSPKDSIIWVTEDDMGESFRQTLILDLLRPLVARWLEDRNITAFVGSDQYIYWDANNPRKSLAPDLYIMPGVSPLAVPTSWSLWKDGVMPVFALEVVGDDIKKDYVDGPKLYDEMGVEELIVFDPLAQEDAGTRIPWQVFRRVKNRGLVRVLASAQDRVESLHLRCWVRAVETLQGTMLRLAAGKFGDDLVPTREESARQEAQSAGQRAQAEAERANAEEERANAEAQHAHAATLRANAAAHHVTALEEELKHLRALVAQHGKGR